MLLRFILRVYDCFRLRPATAWGLFLLLTIALVGSVMRLTYKEDISDFLPLDDRNRTALSVYQQISGANRIYAIIATADTAGTPDPQLLADGVECFTGHVARVDSLGFIADVMKQIDMERMMEVTDAVYDRIPYFLTDADYARMDSLLALPGYADDRMLANRQLLLFPTSSMLAGNITRDPLNLFSPVLGRLNRGGVDIAYDTFDGYILSPDSRRAIVMLESAFGAHESDRNADLVAMLADAKARTEAELPALDIHLIGGPVIAVGNADRIKSDSILAVCIAGVLILALLIYVFRNARNILLILVSVGWGWLFAMGTIALLYDSVSIIVIGIASVILGIAVNYPLHLIDHLRESDRPRAALKEVVAPLVIGNVTTVGAFLCLVPLNATALHDLGLFSSLLLVGTILFVLIFLPHAVRTRKDGSRPAGEPRLITRLASLSVENNRWVIMAVAALTILFGYYSMSTEFDSDMRNINYMTPEQKADMAYFQSLLSRDSDNETLYVVSNGPDWQSALRQNELVDTTLRTLLHSGAATRATDVTAFLCSTGEQERRLRRWQEFTARHAAILGPELHEAAVAHGFNPEAFAPWEEMLAADFQPLDFDQFQALTTTVFAGHVSHDDVSGQKSIVQALEVPAAGIADVKSRIEATDGFTGLCFDVRSMNGSIADTLSDDFNYIGYACGCIVFLFLWLSLGSFELAVVSFLPMAVSWLWILGAMSLLGIKFNIVNVILATFIFGQGDDYTIFMTEGLCYEFAYRRKLLASYKNSIVVSALIMFIGIGTLIFASHPALRSLGQVTVVGMLSVVLMAYLFPPLVFNWLVRKHGRVRRTPLTLRTLLGGSRNLTPKQLVLGRYLYKGADVERNARRTLRRLTLDEPMPELHGQVTVVDPNGQGEAALLLALLHPDTTVRAQLGQADLRALLRGCAEDFTPNLTVAEPGETAAATAGATVLTVTRSGDRVTLERTPL